MSKYKYSDPLERGHIEFKLTKKQHNKLFKYRQIKWHDTYEYFYNEYHIILHKFDNWKSVLLTTILFPISVLLYGVMNCKEAWSELKKLYNQKESGSFVSDHVSRGSEKYDEILDIIKNKMEFIKE